MPHLAKITLNWLALVIGLAVFSCQAMPSHAGTLSLDAGAGLAVYIPTVTNGTWRQDDFDTDPFHTQSFAWRAGLDYAVNERWSIQGHYLDWGSSQADTLMVWDVDYNPKAPKGQQCLANCNDPKRIKVKNTMRGYDLSVSYTWPHAWGPLSPFVKVGGALMYSKLSGIVVNEPDWNNAYFKGQVPMALFGAGACYRLSYGPSLCADSTFYTGFGGENNGCVGRDCGWPIAKQVWISMFSFKVPLWG